MTTATYKGYNISVKHEPKLHPDYAYVAYINDVPGGREHTRDCSEDKALQRLKDRIDNYSAFDQFHFMPLSDEKQSNLVSYIREHESEIRCILRHDHYMLPGRLYPVTASAIYNHYKLIQDTLNAAGNNFVLDIAFLENNQTKCIDKVLLYDANYYSTVSRKNDLEEILRNL